METKTKRRKAKADTNGQTKAKQQFVPGMEPPDIPEVTKAAEQYVEIRNSRMSLTEDEVDAHDKLKELMHKHNLTEYDYEHEGVAYKATACSTEKVKVKKKSDAESNGKE